MGLPERQLMKSERQKDSGEEEKEEKEGKDAPCAVTQCNKIT